MTILDALDPTSLIAIGGGGGLTLTAIVYGLVRALPSLSRTVRHWRKGRDQIATVTIEAQTAEADRKEREVNRAWERLDKVEKRLDDCEERHSECEEVTRKQGTRIATLEQVLAQRDEDITQRVSLAIERRIGDTPVPTRAIPPPPLTRSKRDEPEPTE